MEQVQSSVLVIHVLFVPSLTHKSNPIFAASHFRGNGSGWGAVPLRPWKGSRCWFRRGGHAPSRARGLSGAGQASLSCRHFRFSVSSERASWRQFGYRSGAWVRGPRPHPLEIALVRPSPCQPGRCAPAAPVPLIDDGRGKWRRCLISPMLPRPSRTPPHPRPRAPRASGLSAPEAGPRERPRGGGGGGAGRGRGAAGRGPGRPRDNAAAARAGARAGPASTQGLSGVLIPAARSGDPVRGRQAVRRGRLALG